MISIDTNVLIRVLIDDPTEPKQVKMARNVVEDAGTVFVPQLVPIETVWVLQSAYKFTKFQIIQLLEHLRDNAAFALQNEELFDEALSIYISSNADFSDCVILAEAKNNNAVPLITFDKALSKQSSTKLLSIN